MIQLQTTASSPVPPAWPSPGPERLQAGTAWSAPNSAHSVVIASPGTKFLGCRARLLPQNSRPASLPPAPFSRLFTKKQNQLAWQLLFETVPASGCLVQSTCSLGPLPGGHPALPIFLRVTTQGRQLYHQVCQELGRPTGRCKEGSARVRLAPSSPELSTGLWRAVGWRLHVHRYRFLSEMELTGWGPHVAPHWCQYYKHTPSLCLQVAYNPSGEKQTRQTEQ